VGLNANDDIQAVIGLQSLGHLGNKHAELGLGKDFCIGRQIGHVDACFRTEITKYFWSLFGYDDMGVKELARLNDFPRRN